MTTEETIEITRVSGLSLGTQIVKDPELILLLGEIQEAEEEIRALREKAEMRITLLQEQCPHKNIKEKLEDGEREYDKKNLLSKKCTDCGFKLTKPKGTPWTICVKCWGAMEHVETTPGQGHRVYHYECTICKHHEYHT